MNTVDALALGRAGGATHASRAARLAAALHLPAVARLGVKDAFTSRSRATLTVGALALMVITLVAALCVEATFHQVIDDPALRAKPYDMRVEPGALASRGARLVRNDPAVERATTLTGLQVSGPRTAPSRRARSATPGFAYAVPDGRMFARPGEAIAGRGLYDTLGPKVGDTLTVRVAGQPMTLKLVGRHVEPDNDGEVLIFRRDTLPASVRLGEGEIVATFKPGTDEAAVAQRIEAARSTGVASELTADEVREERADMRPILLGTSLLLVAVGLVNLLATLLLVTRERARDFAIFKAIGLTPRGVLGVVNAGGAALGLIAIVIGIPPACSCSARSWRDEPERGHRHRRRPRTVRARADDPVRARGHRAGEQLPARRRRARASAARASARERRDVTRLSARAASPSRSPSTRPARPPTIPAIPLASVVASGSRTSTAAIASTPSRSLSSSRPRRRPSTSRIVHAASRPSAAPLAPRAMPSLRTRRPRTRRRRRSRSGRRTASPTSRGGARAASRTARSRRP